MYHISCNTLALETVSYQMSDSRETPSPQVSLETGPESTDRKTGWRSRGRNWGQRTGTSLQLVIQTLVLRGVIAPPHLLWPLHDAEIVRTRDPEKLAACDIVVDVGGEYDPQRHRYDHHQR